MIPGPKANLPEAKGWVLREAGASRFPPFPSSAGYAGFGKGLLTLSPFWNWKGKFFPNRRFTLYHLEVVEGLGGGELSYEEGRALSCGIRGDVAREKNLSSPRPAL